MGCLSVVLLLAGGSLGLLTLVAPFPVEEKTSGFVVAGGLLLVGVLLSRSGSSGAAFEQMRRDGVCIACRGSGRMTVTYPDDRTCTACGGRGRALGH